MAHLFRSILVPIQFDDPSLMVLGFAEQLATDQEATLHLLHVATLLPAFGEPDFAEHTHSATEEKARAMLNEITQQRHHLNIKYQVHTASAGPRALGKAIVRLAVEFDVDVILLKTSGRKGLSRFILGNVAEEVVRTAPCPVLTFSPGAQDKTAAAKLSANREPTPP